MLLPIAVPPALARPSAPAATPASAAAPAPTVASYLCTFAGKCDGDAIGTQPTRDAPETKGFRLARPGGEQEASTRTVSASSTARASRHGTRGSTRSQAIVPQSTLLAASTAAGSLIGRRADLMVAFDLDSARLTPEGEASARVFAQSLRTPELSGKRFLIQGHTDTLGGHSYNMSLSERRARAVADYLVSQGVDRTRLQTHGYGPDMPLAGHASSDPANRRVEAELAS